MTALPSRPLDGEHNPFVAGFLADYHADLPRLVYADWLADRGDPGQGEFVRAQVAYDTAVWAYRHQRMKGVPDGDPALTPLVEERRRLWHAAHALAAAGMKRWLGPLRAAEPCLACGGMGWDVSSAHCKCVTETHDEGRFGVRCLWHRGLIVGGSGRLADFFHPDGAPTAGGLWLARFHWACWVRLDDRHPANVAHKRGGRSRRMAWFNADPAVHPPGSGQWGDRDSHLPAPLMPGGPHRRRDNFPDANVARDALQASAARAIRAASGLPPADPPARPVKPPPEVPS